MRPNVVGVNHKRRREESPLVKGLKINLSQAGTVTFQSLNMFHLYNLSMISMNLILLYLAVV